MTDKERLEKLRRYKYLKEKAAAAAKLSVPQSPETEVEPGLNEAEWKQKFKNLSPLDQLLVGMGKGAHDTWTGLKQTLNIGDQDALRREIAQNRIKLAGVGNSIPGMAGNLVGSVGSTAPLAFVPGANTALGATAIGAAMGGFLSPSLSPEEALNNAMMGGAGAGAATAATRFIPGVLKAFARPFSEGGRKKIAAEALRSAYPEKDLVQKLMAAKSRTSGASPTVQEALMTPNVSTLQKSIRNIPGAKDALIGKENANKLARLAALKQVSGSEDDLLAAMAKRESVAAPLYKKAESVVVESDPMFKSLLEKPSIKAALRKADKIAQEQGSSFNVAPKKLKILDASGNPVEVPPDLSGKNLHYLKMGVDDVIQAHPKMGIGGHQNKAVIGTKKELVDWIRQKNPAYGEALDAYTEMSVPINQMQVGEALRQKLTPALSESSINPVERASTFADAIRNQSSLVEKATGLSNKKLADILTKKQLKKILGVKRDLARESDAYRLAATRGSDTAQNLIADQMLKNIAGPLGMPDSFIKATIAKAIPQRVISVAIPGVEQQVQQELGAMMADPKMAADILTKMAASGMLKLPPIEALVGAKAALLNEAKPTKEDLATPIKQPMMEPRRLSHNLR